MVKGLILAALLTVAACQTPGGSFCDVSKPIRLSTGAVDQLSDAEVERLLAHNLKGQKLCGWKP